jgi:hypothetical protein
MAAATINGPGQQSQPLSSAAPPGHVTAALQPPPPAQSAWSPSTMSMPTREELAAVFDVNTNGQAMLSAVGGIALAVLGVRTLFGGRRKAAASREMFRED